MKTVLFDLDGTLLPMEDLGAFVNGYLEFLAEKMAAHGYEKEPLIRAIWAGTEAMIKNDGSRPNEQAFWDCAVKLCGKRILRDVPLFEAFYAVEFEKAKRFCGFAPEAAETVRLVKHLGGRAALATNPFFPAVATVARIRWAGLAPEDFALITTYEDSRYCKPNLDYYREVLQRLDANAGDCVMVGNDVEEDMIARELGMQVFLLTDDLISRRGTDLAQFPHGSFAELQRFLKTFLS